MTRLQESPEYAAQRARLMHLMYGKQQTTPSRFQMTDIDFCIGQILNKLVGRVVSQATRILNTVDRVLGPTGRCSHGFLLDNASG